MQALRRFLLGLIVFFSSSLLNAQGPSFLEYVRSPLYSFGSWTGNYRTLLAETIGCTGYEADNLLKNALSFLVALKHTSTVTGADWRVRSNFLLGIYNAYFIVLDQLHRLWRVYIAQLSSHDLEELRSIVKEQSDKIEDATYKAKKMLKASYKQDESWVTYEDLFGHEKRPLMNSTFPLSPWNQTQMQVCVNYTSFKFLYDLETVSTIFKGMLYWLMDFSKKFSQFQSYYLGIQNPVSLGYVYALMVKKFYNGYISFFNNMPEFKVVTSTLYPIWFAQTVIEINAYKFSLDFFKLIYSIATGFRYVYSYEEYLEQIEEASKKLSWAKEEYAKIAPKNYLNDDGY